MHDEPGGQGGRKKSTAWQLVRAVFWSFFGVRRRADYQADFSSLKPAHVIIAGLIGAALFVAGLLFLVSLIVK